MLKRADASPTTRWGDRKFRPDIQGLRALAVLLVVLYHVTIPGLPGGFVGVDVFLVISGFLITRQLITEGAATGTISISRFYGGRIRRLLPASLTVVIATVLVAHFWGPALNATATARDGILAALYSINYGLAAQGVDYQHTTTAVSPLLHFWSLAVEEQFYLAWPILIALIIFCTRGKLHRFRTAALFLLTVTIAVCSFITSVHLTAVDPPLAYFSLQSRAWELAVGALVALSIRVLRHLGASAAAVLSWLGLAAILYSAVIFTDSTPFPSFNALVPVIGTALIICAGMKEQRLTVEMFMKVRPVQFLGAVSYSWYLWHWPLIVLAPFLFRIPFSWPQKFEVAIVALWLGVLSYLIFERSEKRKKISRPFWFTLGSAATAITVAASLFFSVVLPPSLAGVSSGIAVLGASPTAQEALVLSAVGVTKMPPAAVASLATAFNDYPLISDRCMVPTLGTESDACVYGDPTAKRTIVLFGDSHAEQWFGALNKIATGNGWRLVVWTKAGCGFSKYPNFNTNLKRIYTECITWHNNILPKIKAMHPDVIVASQLTYGDTGGVPQPIATGAAITELKAMTDHLIYLADTPLVPQEVPPCLAANLTAIEKCSGTAYDVNVGPARSEKLRRNQIDAAVLKMGVSVIDPEPWFCVKEICPAVIAKTIVYRDNSHVTQKYMLGLAPLLLAELVRTNPAFARGE